METKLEQAGTDADARVAGVVKDYAIRMAVNAAGTIDPDVVKLLIKPDDIKVEGDNVTGITEQLETLRKEKPYLFKDNGGKLYFGVSDTTAGAIVAMTESEKAEYRIGISIDYTERMI